MAVVNTQNPRIHGVRLSAADPPADADTYTSGDLVLPTIARGFHANAAGNLIVDMMGGIDGRTPSTNVTFVVLAGVQYPMLITKIYNTSVAGVVLY